MFHSKHPLADGCIDFSSLATKAPITNNEMDVEMAQMLMVSVSRPRSDNEICTFQESTCLWDRGRVERMMRSYIFKFQ